MRHFLLIFGVFLAGCGSQQPGEGGEDGAAAGNPIALQPIGYREIETYNLFGNACAFAPTNGGLGSMFMGLDEAGYIKLADQLVTIPADTGGPQLPYGAYQEYAGGQWSASLTITGQTSSSGGEVENYPGRLVLRDGPGQIVYDQPGLIQCGA